MHRYLFAALAFSPAAFAGDEVDPETGVITRYEDVQEVDYEEQRVTADVVGPQLTLVFEGRTIVFEPMIELRKDFIPEMRESVDEVH
jgi:hypothetical protein